MEGFPMENLNQKPEADLEEEEGSEESSYEEESGSGESDSETGSGSEEDTDEEEPVLKYKRFAKEVVSSIHDGTGMGSGERNIICCIAVHPKFIALGTYDGSIKLLDHTGTLLKDRVYALHSSQINQISVDTEGEFLASCSNDGKVSIIGLFTTKYNNTNSFGAQVNSVAIHPYFGRNTSRMFAYGTDKLVLVEERRWPLTNKVNQLDAGYGRVTTIKWKDNLIAWANEKMVMVYDVALREKITSISFEEESLVYLPCSLYWQDSSNLLVGRGHIVKTVTVQEGEEEQRSTLTTEVVDVPPKKKKFMFISAHNTFPKFLVCGVVPLIENKQCKLVMLGYSAEISPDATRSAQVPPPHLVVVSPGYYNPVDKEFEHPEHITKDKLLPKGYQYCHCEEYHLESVVYEDRFYIVTPIDIILAQKRDANDHIDWLVDKQDFEEAMQYAENPNVARVVDQGKLQEIGIEYIYYLMKKKNFSEAARKCHEVIGKTDKRRWEDIIVTFMQKKQLKEIRPFIPISDPVLSPAIYELVLHELLQEDCQTVYQVIKAWPTTLYSPQVIINAVEMRMQYDPGNKGLLKVKACLHEDLEQFDEAMKIYLQQGHIEVFELIQQKKLYSALVENLIPLLKVDTQRAVKLLVECRQDVPPQKVVKELDVSSHEKYLHMYLDCLFEQDPKCGGVYHERQVELYARFDPDKLLLFLRSCNDIPLQKALEVCEYNKRYKEMVYLLGRMGNQKAALELIIKKLEDVDMAIEFTMEEGDEDLWELLISLSIHKPTFITGLLNNVGTHIDPTKLIKKIPERTEIPNLGRSLVKLLQDFQVQVNLREGCKKILVKDSHSLMEKLHRLQKRPIHVDNDAKCKTCCGEVIDMDEQSDYVIFFCGHIYHQRCAPKRNDMMVCRSCYSGKTITSQVPMKSRRLH
ncbi:vacuolar protein sorting-associated protein 41 homolog [Halichondria panicea]|uniref:vacuolar protein sorting-associated protein 41 homolog n=1 Tax=Halichondria panicea TaxID=6063 RepID=UPI00312BA82C